MTDKPIAVPLVFRRANGETETVTLTWDDPTEAMRAANAALPDGHAAKITERMAEVADWAALEAADAAAKYPEVAQHFRNVADDARALHAALRALLPKAG